MRLVFRADASAQIGVGHVMRLCAIAEKSILNGDECLFVGDLGGIIWLKKYVESVGFKNIIARERIQDVVSVENILILDSYEISKSDPSINIDNWGLVVSIFDDKTPVYNAHLHIHPGIDQVDSSGRTGKIYGGSEYIPFRSSITKVSKMNSEVEKILVFAGGTDTFNMAFEIAQVLSNLIEFKSAIFISSNKSEIEGLDSRFSVFEFGSVLDELVVASDLVITAASTSSLEIAVRGIPLSVISVVDNQVSNYNAIAAAQIAECIGSRSSDGTWNIDEELIRHLISESDRRRSLISNASRILDLKGNERLLNLIYSQAELNGLGIR